AKVKAYTEHVIGGLDKLADQQRIVGFAIAVNGDVKAVERFASPALFKKYKDKLLRSYFVGAVDQPVVAEAPAATTADVDGFIAKGKAGVAAKVVEATTSETTHYDAKDVKGSKVVDRAAKPEAA